MASRPPIPPMTTPATAPEAAPTSSHQAAIRTPVRHEAGPAPARSTPAVVIGGMIGRGPARARVSREAAAARRPSSTVTARPDSSTRSPRTSTRTMPPRAEAWWQTSRSRPRRAAQKGPRAQWAEPVTGSSGMP